MLFETLKNFLLGSAIFGIIILPVLSLVYVMDKYPQIAFWVLVIAMIGISIFVATFLGAAIRG